MQNVDTDFLKYLENGGEAVYANIEEKYVEQILHALDHAKVSYFCAEDKKNGASMVVVKKESQNTFLDIQKKVFHYPYSIEDKKSKMITLYHGSDHVIESPQYGFGKPDNDYGSGFYTTNNKDKSDLWACMTGKPDSAITNEYLIDLQGLSVLNINDYGVLAWIAELAYNRGTRTELGEIAAEMLIDMYKIDTSKADVIVGYRADSVYLEIVDAFLEGELTTTEVDTLFRKGDLGNQYCIVSQKAFDKIKFTKAYECEKIDVDLFETKAKNQVSKFLDQRRQDIKNRGFIPQGLTIDDVTKTQFVYNKDTQFYEVEEMEGQYEHY